MIQATKPTFSFGVLLLIALGLVGAVYYISQQVHDQLQLPPVPAHKNVVNKAPSSNITSPLTAAVPATDDWQVYNDDNHFLSFKYPQDWNLKIYNESAFDVVSLDPGSGRDHIRIYISATGFVGMDGLQTTPITVGGQQGINASDMVVGVKNGKSFFTFDAGSDQNQIPEFKGIISTVSFNQ